MSTQVRSLTVGLGGVVNFKKSLEQLQIGDFLRVKGHPHGLCMAGVTIADLVVSRIQGLTLLIPTLGADDSRSFFEGVFDSPEATSSKVGDFLSANLRLDLPCTFHSAF